MGIKELWPFLNPYCMRKPLYELQGKTVAIDLAGWICESLCVVDYEVQSRFYLRNLFFRTCYLILSGITPVFVLEGTAPALKQQMITKRNQIQFRGARPRKNTQSSETQSQAASETNPKKANKGRTRFNYVLKQCEELIRSMGLQCVQGPGEAEAFCSHLNAFGLVDGVISQDSDCFAYGARRVFRNFSLSMQGTAGSIGGSIDIYDLDFVQKSIDFGRNKMIVMALLCGCDYCPEGVGGVGRDAVQKLFTTYTDADILERIQLWRQNDNKFTELEMKVDDKKLCTDCGHYGRVQSHAKSGCSQCKQSIGCDSSSWKAKRLALKSELQIRKKAMQCDAFPSQEIIDEFMQEPIDMSKLQLDWCQPNLVKFVRMMSKLIQWDEIYCLQKFLPLLTRWQLHHMCDAVNDVVMRGNVQPDFIKKKRTPKGVPSYEIIWKDGQGCFDALIPGEQLQIFYSTNEDKTKTEALQTLCTTIEPIDLFTKAYPDLVNQFEEAKAKGKPKKTKTVKEPKKSAKGRKDKDTQAVETDSLDAAETVKITKKRAAAKPKKVAEKLRPIDLFFRKEKKTNVYESPKIKTTSNPINLSAFMVGFNDSIEDDMNLSAIINEMVSRPPNVTEIHGKKLRFDDINTGIANGNTQTNIVIDEKENEQNVVAEESFDEFDLIVMRKARKSLLTRRLATNSDQIVNCSTPVLRRIDVPSGSSLRQHSKLDCSVYCEPSERRNSVISSSFYANAEDEVDLFEKSVDYRNMPDVVESDDSDSPVESGNNSQTSQTNDDMYDTFDRLVGLA